MERYYYVCGNIGCNTDSRVNGGVGRFHHEAVICVEQSFAMSDEDFFLKHLMNKLHEEFIASYRRKFVRYKDVIYGCELYSVNEINKK